MKRLFTGLTDPGLLRAANQDAYHLDPEGRFFIVADGMGGHAGGQEASRIATQAIQTYLNECWHVPEDPKELLYAALQKANRAILQDQKKHPERSDMGTTAVVVIFREDERPWCAHVGDSRLYRFRGTNLEQITEDHTWVAKALKDGQITRDQALNHPWRHVLSQCLGREDLHQIDIQPFEIQPQDCLLLCSDGLTEELTDTLIAKYLTVGGVEDSATALVDAAKDMGGRDNITVVLVVNREAPTRQPLASESAQAEIETSESSKPASEKSELEITESAQAEG